jgi:monovalent cation:H+ antiporter, CPA1 family
VATILGGTELFVLLLVLSIAVSLMAYRLRFPYTLALVLVGLLIGVAHLSPTFHLDPDVVLLIFLPALLFQGAWELDVTELRQNGLAIALLAGPGLLIALVVAAVFIALGTGLPPLIALLIGAVISPTDPVAVLGLLRQLGLPARLRTLLEGESLFNDGIGAAVFEGLLLIVIASATPGAHTVWWQEALAVGWLLVGGPIIGLLVAGPVLLVVRRIDDNLLETAITFGVAYGTYLLAMYAHTSGLLAVITAGLFMGSYGRRLGMSTMTSETVDTVWAFIGFIANLFLFLLLGIEIGGNLRGDAIPGIAWAIAGVLAGRALMLWLVVPVQGLFARRGAPGASPVPRGWMRVLFLSGLRGALSIALALSLPAGLQYRSQIQVIVYGVVLVTLVGQGVLMRLLLPRWKLADSTATQASA